MAKKKQPAVVMALAMTDAQLRKMLDQRSCSAASPHASKRDLLQRRNGKIARRDRTEAVSRHSW